MRKIFISLFIIFTQNLFSQTHSIEDLVVELSGNASNSDFSNNTYYYAYDSCNISWEIISESIPDGWDFSFCFPICYSPGVTSGSHVFLNNSIDWLKIVPKSNSLAFCILSCISESIVD